MIVVPLPNIVFDTGAMKSQFQIWVNNITDRFNNTAYITLSSDVDQIPSTTAETVVTLNENLIVAQKNILFDAATEIFTFQKSGIYGFSIIINAGLTSPSSGVDLFVWAKLNGSDAASVAIALFLSNQTDFGTNTLPIFAFPVNAGDEVQLVQKVSSTAAGPGLMASPAGGGLPPVRSVVFSVQKMDELP